MSEFITNIMDHPDKEEIISKLITGVDIRIISEWLKIKYPGKDQGALRLTMSMLNAFVKSQYMDFYNDMKKDVQAVQAGHHDKVNKKISDSIKNNKTYAERLNDIAEEEIDIKRALKNLCIVGNSRMEQIFDKIQEDPSVVGKSDEIFIKFMTQMTTLIEKVDKIVNNKPDQVIQHNYTVAYADNIIAQFQDIFREVVIASLDTETSMLILDKFADAMNKAKPINQENVTQESKRLEVGRLKNKLDITDAEIEEIEDKGDSEDSE